MIISAPQPSVVHLFTIFRQINNGELRVPAFQREFVWKERQVLDLLTSVRDQYPIGSILLWYVDQKMLEIASHEVTSFPDVAERYPTSYILDGMQRLSTLYGTFHFSEGMDEIFNVYYDLRTSMFVHHADLDLLNLESSIPLAALLSPRKILEHQSHLSRLADGDALLEELLRTQAAFQDYLIPIVSIKSSDVDRVVGIFERTNSTGTRLDTVDFMRAITWNRDFDLNRFLDATRSPLQANGYDLDEETVIKCVGLLLGVPPTAKGLLSLRSRSPSELKKAFDQFPSGFAKVAEFLYQRFRIQNLDYVPYEGQLLVLFKTIGMGEADGQEQLQRLERWIWSAGFNESLRGKPDHYVVRAVEDWESLLAGHIRGLEARLRLTPEDFLSRRLIKGKALSVAFVAMFSARNAKGLFTGEPIPPSLYMSSPDVGSFSAIIGSSDLRAAGLEVGPSSRIFPNMVLLNPSEEAGADSEAIRSRISQLIEEGRTDILESQFIDAPAAALLVEGAFAEFLQRRAASLHAAAQGLVGPSSPS